MLRAIVPSLACCALLAAADTVAPPSPGVNAPEAPTTPSPGAPEAGHVAPGGQVRGTISYGRHDPAVGAIVILRSEDSGSPVRLATTGTSGGFAFDGLSDGTYRVEVRRDGYVPIVKSGIAVRAPFRAVVELILVPGDAPHVTAAPGGGTASISGTVSVAGGAPLAEAHVKLSRDDGADDAWTLLTDGKGSFSVPKLKAGHWRLDVQGAGLLPVRAELDLSGDVALDVQLAAQPANYKPSPRDLIVPEDVIPPPGTS